MSVERYLKHHGSESKPGIMKRFLFLAAILAAALFTSCEKEGVPHTGDLTGNLYGVWTLTNKTEVVKSNDGDKYREIHFLQRAAG